MKRFTEWSRPPLFLMRVALDTTPVNLWLIFNTHSSGVALILYSPQKWQQLWAKIRICMNSSAAKLDLRAPWKPETQPIKLYWYSLARDFLTAGSHFPTMQDSIHCTAAVIPSMNVCVCFSRQFSSTLARVTFLPFFFSPPFFFWRDTRSLKGHDLHINHSRAGFRQQKLAF